MKKQPSETKKTRLTWKKQCFSLFCGFDFPFGGSMIVLAVGRSVLGSASLHRGACASCCVWLITGRGAADLFRDLLFLSPLDSPFRGKGAWAKGLWAKCLWAKGACRL